MGRVDRWIVIVPRLRYGGDLTGQTIRTPNPAREPGMDARSTHIGFDRGVGKTA